MDYSIIVSRHKGYKCFAKSIKSRRLKKCRGFMRKLYKYEYKIHDLIPYNEFEDDLIQKYNKIVSIRNEMYQELYEKNIHTLDNPKLSEIDKKYDDLRSIIIGIRIVKDYYLCKLIRDNIQIGTPMDYYKKNKADNDKRCNHNFYNYKVTGWSIYKFNDV